MENKKEPLDINAFKDYCRILSTAIHDINTHPRCHIRRKLLRDATELVNAAYVKGLKDGLKQPLLQKIIQDALITT